MNGGGEVVVVGAGTMGADIAALFVGAGWPAQLIEPSRDRWTQSEARLRRALDQLGAPAAEAKFHYRERLEQVPWEAVTLAIECVPEDLALKQRVFAELASLAPQRALLASNSSSFPISDIGRGLPTRERMLGLHFFMPAHLVPAVEVIRGEATDPGACERAAALMRRVGKVSVNVRKDLPGFLANRIQHAMMREAFALIDAGLADPEDVDAAVHFGFGLRFLGAGPMLQRDLAGLDVHCAAAATVYPGLANDTRPAEALAGRVARGELGVKTGQGFYRWDDAAAARAKDRYDRALLAALQILRSEGELPES